MASAQGTAPRPAESGTSLVSKQSRHNPRIRNATTGKVQVSGVIHIDSDSDNDADDGDTTHGDSRARSIGAPNAESRPTACNQPPSNDGEADADGSSELTELSDEDDGTYAPSEVIEGMTAQESRNGEQGGPPIRKRPDKRVPTDSTPGPARHHASARNRRVVKPHDEVDFERLVRMLEGEDEFAGGIQKWLLSIKEQVSAVHCASSFLSGR